MEMVNTLWKDLFSSFGDLSTKQRLISSPFILVVVLSLLSITVAWGIGYVASTMIEVITERV